MARFSGAHNSKQVYQAAETFRDRCLAADGSLLSQGAAVWTLANLQDLKRRFNDNPEEGKRSFIEKFRDQLQDASPDVKRLGAEALCVYLLFPSKIGPARKRAAVNEVLEWVGEQIADDSEIVRAFQGGLGGAGLGYNTRRPYELGYLIELALKLKMLGAERRADLLADPWTFREFAVDVEDGKSKQLRHILLHLLFPEEFERIGSARQKAQVLAVFKPLARSPADNEDQQLLSIRQQLGTLLGRPPETLDFYEKPLVSAWYDGSDEDEDDAGPSVELVQHKRQVVLYGPPGTGKTFQAKQLARKLIHACALAQLGPTGYFESQAAIEQRCVDNVHRLQLHPAYSYEDFVRGLHIVPGGATEYKPGRLLTLIAEIEEQRKGAGPHLPHVLILDEMNRTDLSRMLGECFSLLENRNETVDLPGHGVDGKPMTLRIPDDLYIVGTMNLIDQSVEQLDFALRRRFFWFLCPFSTAALLVAAEARWNEVQQRSVQAGGRGVSWNDVSQDFADLAAAAADLNARIRDSAVLGAQYEIGHTYFLDIVEFLHASLPSKGAPKLWNSKNEPTDPIHRLWRLSISPLLEQYLGGLDSQARELELAALRAAFLRPRAPVK
ncbi:McrB family protein [Massilia haematophila]|uniref:McrB family protein n=1 Tax=Massilia haematophila TaxID=457923 RepID=A0ABV7PJW9_9BURK